MKAIIIIAMALVGCVNLSGLIAPEYSGDDAATVYIYKTIPLTPGCYITSNMVPIKELSEGVNVLRLPPGDHVLVGSNAGQFHSVPVKLSLKPRDVIYMHMWQTPLVVIVYLDVIDKARFDKIPGEPKQQRR